MWFPVAFYRVGNWSTGLRWNTNAACAAAFFEDGVTRLLWFGLYKYKELHCVICRGKAEGIANKVQVTLKVFLYVLYVLCAQNKNMNWWL
jgi:hypothetical protein